MTSITLSSLTSWSSGKAWPRRLGVDPPHSLVPDFLIQRQGVAQTTGGRPGDAVVDHDACGVLPCPERPTTLGCRRLHDRWISVDLIRSLHRVQSSHAGIDMSLTHRRV